MEQQVTKTSELGELAVWFISEFTENPHTQRAYRRAIVEFLAFLQERKGDGARLFVEDFTRPLVKEFMQALVDNYKNATARLHFYAVRRFGAVLANEFGLPNAAYGVKPPLDRWKEHIQLSGVEVDRIRNFLSAHGKPLAQLRNGLVFELYYETGFRGSEAIRITMGQVDLLHGCFRDVLVKCGFKQDKPISKSLKKEIMRWLPLREALLRDYFRERGYDWSAVPQVERGQYPLIPKLRSAVPGKPESFRYSYSFVKRLCTEIETGTGIRCHSHIFRHTFAQDLADKQYPLRDISSALGHRTPNEAMRYTERSMAQVRAMMDSRAA